MTSMIRWRKAVAGATLAALVWTGAVVPAPGDIASAATPFSDVRAGHWAEKHINKLSLQGLLLGNVDGTYKPANPVTREQAVVIALRFLGMEDSIPDTAVAFPEFFEVGDYYKKYVNYAFKQNLIRSEEEFNLAQSEAGKPWGNAPATREWVARLLVRTIGKEADAAANAGAGTGFADDGDIGEAYKGYVRAAVNLGLIKGVTETEFRPKDIVNRATIATLFSRAQAVYPEAVYSGQTSGILFERTPDRLTVLHEDGTMTEYAVSADTLFYRADSETAASADDMVTYGTVTVISKDGRRADYVELLDATPKVAVYEGTFLTLNKNAGTITLLVGNDVQQFAYDANRPPKVTDLENQSLSLDDLETNMPVKVLVDTLRTPRKAVAVSVKQSAVNKTGQGTIVSVDTAARTVTVTDAAGNRETRSVAEDVLITLDKRLMELERLQPGDVVTYTVKAGVITEIAVDKQAVRTVSGSLFKVDPEDRTIAYKADGEIVVKFYRNDVSVTIEGLTDAGVSDLEEGDAITLTLDDEGNVQHIQVTNRSLQIMNGVVGKYDAAFRSLIVTDGEGKNAHFFLAENVRYDVDGNRISAEDAVKRLTPGTRLHIGYSGGEKIYFISFITQYTGTVVEHQPSEKKIRLQLNDGSYVTVPYTSPTVDIYGRNNETVGDVKVGDRVTVVLHPTQNAASAIRVEKVVQFEITSVDVSANKLTGKRPDGSTDWWVVGSSVPLLDAQGAAIPASALTTGSVVNVTYMGNTAVKVQVVPVVLGRVASVDAAAGSLKVVAFNGTVHEHTVLGSPIVYRGNTTLTSLASVQPDDRVEIRKDESGRTIVTIMDVQEKSFMKAEVSTRTLYWLKTTLSETNTVPYHPQVYVHDGDKTLSLSDLKYGDKIKIYSLRGTAMEIMKHA